MASPANDRTRYVRHETNVGANGNFNACIEHALGEYVLVPNDDDRIDPNMMAHCMAATCATPIRRNREVVLSSPRI
jgi:glycosyltransferase involved in cell wall biosynthesis